jgi:ketosteroid isomerase-like protein
MKANGKTEAAVLATLDKLTESYAKRDMEGLMALIAPDDDLVLFGTGADERRVGRDEFRLQAERDWAQSEALDFQIGWHSVSAAGSVAWLAADGTGRGRAGGQEFAFPFRLTAVLEQRGDEWLFVQSHFSLPSAAQEEGDSVPV